jgi:hypothetical protein
MPGNDVDAAAGGVGGDHLALEVLDFLDRAVGEHLEIVGAIAHGAVLELIGDDAQVVHAGVLDRDRQSRIGKVADFQLIVGHCRDHRRRARIAAALEHVGLAEVNGEVLFLQPDRGPVGHRRHPGAADFQRLRLGCGDGTKCQHAEGGAAKFRSLHYFLRETWMAGSSPAMTPW